MRWPLPGKKGSGWCRADRPHPVDGKSETFVSPGFCQRQAGKL